MHLWTLVRGHVSRTALANPLPPSVTTTSGAGIGDMRADHALEFSDLAMYQETDPRGTTCTNLARNGGLTHRLQLPVSCR